MGKKIYSDEKEKPEKIESNKIKDSSLYIGCLCPGPVDTEFNKVANSISTEISIVVKAFGDLKDATAEGARGTTEVAMNAEQVALNTGYVREEAEKLKVVSQKLDETMQQFIV